jgi:hypothetical protein
VPLKQVVKDAYGRLSDRKTEEVYGHLVRTLGPEFFILREAGADALRSAGGEIVAEAVGRVRAGRVERVPGYDGVFGTISLFRPEEREKLLHQSVLFQFSDARKERKSSEGTVRRGKKRPAAEKAAVRTASAQQKAVLDSSSWPVAVVAGPGTGKTFTLVEKIRALCASGQARAGGICAVTFTNKASRELRGRLGSDSRWIGTIHSIALALIRSGGSAASIVSSREASYILSGELQCKDPARRQREISLVKSTLLPDEYPSEPLFVRYNAYLEENGFMDLDDIVVRAWRSLREDEKTRSFVRSSLDAL